MDEPVPNTKLLNALYLKCWTQEKLSRESNVPEAYISRIIRGKMIPTADQRQAIAKALKVQEGRVF